MAEPKIKMQIWQAMLKKLPGPAFPGLFEARDERHACLVAQKYADLNNTRFIGGSVKPYILADESILLIKTEPEEEPIPDAVSATTAVNAG
jgi:hypothetical protein